jgi:hypothetical protein
MAKGARALQLLCIAVALAGCDHLPLQPGVQTKTELETAIAEVKDEWLKPCRAVAPTPGNSIGSFLQDATEVALAGAECAARHNSFVDYIAPIIRREKGTKPAR